MKKGLSLLLFLVSCIIIPGIFVKLATAQVTPDGTTNTTVNAQGDDFTIQNGDRAGNNLFHSFQDFSVNGANSGIFNQVLGGAAGTSGGINLATANLSLTQGGVVTANTFGQGDGGAITIDASDTISVVGANSGIFSQVLGGAVGNVGQGDAGRVSARKKEPSYAMRPAILLLEKIES